MSRPKKLPNGLEFNGWRFTTTKGPIANGEQLEKFEAGLKLPVLPEEVYSANSMVFEHIKSGERIEFNAHDALAKVDAEHDLVKVAYAKKWTGARRAELQGDEVKILKPYDWTFTTDHPGTASAGCTVQGTEDSIDIESLKARDPILFHDHLHFFGDDFGDNGAVMLTAQVRVMPTAFFALQRLFVRVDDVLVRVVDTRVWYRFGAPTVIREQTHREQTFEELEAQMGVKGDRRAALAMYQEDRIHEIVDKLPITKVGKDCITMPA